MKIFWRILTSVITFALLALCETFIIFDYGVWGVIACAALFLAFPVSSILHECGHSLFGACVKIKAVPEGGFGRFLIQAFIKWWDSSSVTLIPRTDNGLRKRLIITSFGGIAVNSVFIILGVIALSVPAVPTWLSVLLPASFYLVALNAMPLYLGGGKTDGLVLDELLKNDANAQVAIAVMTVQAKILNGAPIQDMADILFNLPQIREDDRAFIALTQLRYDYYTAIGDEENAQKQNARLQGLQQYL